MVDVFISYSRSNRDLVCRLADAIGRLGYVVWWDEELPAHLSYGEVITQKIEEAKATLVVWSADSAASEWVRAEADMARNEKKLIQTAIGDCTPPLPFNQIQYAAIGDWHGEEDHAGWRKVQASLAALCGPAPAGTAPAAPESAEPEPDVVAAPEPVSVPEPVAVTHAPAVPLAPVAPQPRRAMPAPRAKRLAFAAIAASLLTILTVGGLVLIKGPPAARATVAEPAPAPAAPPPARAPVPAQAAIRAPKAVVVEAPVQAARDEADSADYGGDAGDDY